MYRLLTILMLIVAVSVDPINAQTPSVTELPTKTPTATPTVTPSPTLTATAIPATQTPYIITATPSPMPTANPPQADAYELNNTAGTASLVSVPASIEKLNFYPQGDVDYFRFTIKPSQAGLTLTLDTYTDVGIDTVLGLTSADGTELASNDDYSPTDPRSHIAIKLAAGDYMAVINNRAPTRAEFKTYRFELKLVEAPPASIQPTAQPIEQGTWDQFEGKNFTWDTASPIAIGAEYSGLNFVCPSWEHNATCLVSDFYQIPVKQGTCYTAQTSVTAGIDTNLIVYNEQRDSVAPLTGNDDKTPTDFGSSAIWCSSYQGIAYLLIGQVGNKPPPPPIAERTYTLVVSVWVESIATPQNTATAISDTSPASVNPTIIPPSVELPNNLGIGNDMGAGVSEYPSVIVPPANSTDGLDQPLAGVIIQEIRPDQIEQPTSIPQIVVTIASMVCFDRNSNQACDIDEGIAGVSMYINNANSGDLLAQGITDQDGRVQMTIRSAEEAQLSVSVPMFAAVQQISARSPQTRPIVIKSSANLPALIP